MDDLADLTEPFVDEASQQLLKTFAGTLLPEILENLPVVKTGIVVGKLFNSAKAAHRAKLMHAFLQQLQSGNKSMDEFDKLSNEDKEYIRGIVISQLDMQTDERQAEAMAHIVDVYLNGEVDRLTFIGLAAELKNTNPLLYYFSVDAISITRQDNGVVEASGPTYLLPATFGHNTVTGIGQGDSSGEYKFVLTQLGQAFYANVYEPMAIKYMM